jgi:large conductance mechanosensitive channel
MLKEFKEFAMKGSLIDTAIAFVMGAAFAGVSTSFINGMFMPLVAMVFQVGDMSGMKLVLKDAVVDAAGKVTTPETAIMYGTFLGAVINFLIVAFIMFLVVKAMNKMKKEEPAAAPAISSSDALLMEIRDGLKK